MLGHKLLLKASASFPDVSSAKKEAQNRAMIILGARYYWNGAERWRRADPVMENMYDPQRMNCCSYCLNDPINYIDPDGGNPIPIIQLPNDPELRGSPANDAVNTASDFALLLLNKSHLSGLVSCS